MTEPVSTTPPEPTTTDDIRDATNLVLNTIPVVGGPISAIFKTIFASPLERRRDRWLQELAEAISFLIEKVGRIPKDLEKDEAFISTVLQASQIAQRNHREEKIDSLRNAVINSGSTSGENDLYEIFLRLIDSLTVSHVTVLKLLSDPRKWFEDRDLAFPIQEDRGTSDDLVKAAIPELRDQGEGRLLIYEDLKQSGLVNNFPYRQTRLLAYLASGQATGLGRQFLDFIHKPDIPDASDS